MLADFLDIILTTAAVMTGLCLIGIGIGTFIAWRKERELRKFLEED